MTVKDKARCHIRWMIRRDMPRVLEIERACYAVPWEEEDFLTLLRERDHVGMVMEVEEQEVGYMVFQLHKRYLLLLSLTVDPAWQRRGVGAQAIARLAGKLSGYRRYYLAANLRESNLGGLAFFKAQEFQAVGILKGYYADGKEDAVRMILFSKGSG